MYVVQKHKETTMHSIFSDTDISVCAKGVYAILKSLDDNTDPLDKYPADYHSILNGLYELARHDYIYRCPIFDKDNRIVDYEIWVFNTPQECIEFQDNRGLI